jgi:hypothetical protein
LANHQPDSLCARLLKSKYYPNVVLADTTFIKNSSPCWQGISHGVDFLKQGIIWRTNNGKKIRLWRDNWIPRGYLKVSGNTSGSRLRWVADLIDHQTKEWKEDMVRSIFYTHDVEAILKIRLPNIEGEDFCAWFPDPHGQFSIRSA